MKETMLLLASIAFLALPAGADTLILKSGMELQSERIWQDGDEIKCDVNGVTVGFPVREVKRIERAPGEEKSLVPPSGASGPGFDAADARKRLEALKRDLDREYRGLLKSYKRLETDRKPLDPEFDAGSYNRRVSAYNRKATEYERKRNAFDKAAGAYAAGAAPKPVGELLDEAEFSKILSSWLKRPVDAFAEEWGRPDSIVRRPDNSRRYVFRVEVDPYGTREIVFDTDSSGRIVSFQTEIRE